MAALAKVSRADAAAAEGRLTEAVIGEWGMEVADVERAASRPSRLTERIVAGLDGDAGAAIRDRRRANYAVLADAPGPLCPERVPEPCRRACARSTSPCGAPTARR